MKKVMSYLEMKRDMFLMDLFDNIYKALVKADLESHADYIVNKKDREEYFDKWVQSEREASDYAIQLVRKDEYIYYLEQKLDLYENQKED